MLRQYIEYKYKEDNWGNVIKRSYKLRFLRKEKGADGYYIHYISGIHMFFFSINYFKRNYYKKYISDKINEYNINEIYNEIYDSWDHRLYKKIFKKYLKLRYYYILSDIKIKHNFYKLINKYKYNNITKKEYDSLLKSSPTDFNVLSHLVSVGAKGKYLDKIIRKEKILSVI